MSSIRKPRDPNDIVYPRSVNPFEITWEEWTASWSRWFFLFTKKDTPALDNNGMNCARNQVNPYVWFLAGTFGNTGIVKRKCTIPKKKAILFPIILKECSFAEDLDLNTEDQLIARSKSDIDNVTYIEANIDGVIIRDLDTYRVQSRVSDLFFPQGNVYDVSPGVTKSVCYGYWIFLKPMRKGQHTVTFAADAALPENYVVTDRIRKTEIYKPILEYIEKNSSMHIHVNYQLQVE